MGNSRGRKPDTLGIRGKGRGQADCFKALRTNRYRGSLEIQTSLQRALVGEYDGLFLESIQTSSPFEWYL